MSGISRLRWTESDKRRLLSFRDNHPDWSWEAITELFPGRSATGLCKMYSDLKKTDRTADQEDDDDEETEGMENNDVEATEEKVDQANDGDESNEEMVDQANDDNEAAEEMANDDEESTEEMANSQSEGTSSTELSKESKRSPDLEEDSEAPPRKQRKTRDVAANDEDDPSSNPSEGTESRGNIKISWEVTLAPHQLPISFVTRLERS